MNDVDLGEVLRRLPRTTASPRYTSNVIRRLHDTPPRRLVWRMAPAVAMMMMLVAGLYAASVRRERQRIQTLRGERQQIVSELQRVKAIAPTSVSVLLSIGKRRSGERQ